MRARAYDLALNGTELGGGSIRIHRRDLQERVFAVVGIGEEEARERFGFLLEGLSCGAPPHGGIAFGLDRLVMLLAGATSLREVIAFPKTASGADPLTGAPAAVDDAQLRELGLLVRTRGCQAVTAAARQASQEKGCRREPEPRPCAGGSPGPVGPGVS